MNTQSDNQNKREELRAMIEKLAGSGAHACYCPRSTDGGCTCALKDEYIDEILQAISPTKQEEKYKLSLDVLIEYLESDTAAKDRVTSYKYWLETKLKAPTKQQGDE